MEKNLTEFLVLEEAILKQEFEIDFKGYNVEEVDRFLDYLSSVIKNFRKELVKINDSWMHEQTKNKKLMQEMNELKSAFSLLKEQKSALEAKGVENVDIITRLSKLESIVNED